MKTYARTLVLVPVLVALAAGCGKVEEITVGGAKLGEADGTIEAPEGADVVVAEGSQTRVVVKSPNQGATALAIPVSGPLLDELMPKGSVRLAIDRDVPFVAAKPLLDYLYQRDGKAVALVTNTGLKRKLLAVELFPAGEKHEQATQVAAYANGKMCVNLPGVDRAKCSQGRLGNIDRATTRGIVREAYDAEDLTYAVVSVEPSLPWGDVVRAVDGARTCCGPDVAMRVELRERNPDEFHIPE